MLPPPSPTDLCQVITLPDAEQTFGTKVLWIFKVLEACSRGSYGLTSAI